MHLWQNGLNAHEKREGRELSKKFSNGYATTTMRSVHVCNSFANLHGQELCHAVHGMQVLTLAFHEMHGGNYFGVPGGKTGYRWQSRFWCVVR